MSPLTDSYGEDEYFDDLMLVTKGITDEALARLTIRSSEECLPWMEAHGVRFQPSLSELCWLTFLLDIPAQSRVY